VEKIGKLIGNGTVSTQVSSRSVAPNQQGSSEYLSNKVADNSDQQRRPNTWQPRRRRVAGVATDLTNVKSILSKVLSHRGMDKRVERYEFILHWHSIVGSRLAEVTKPDCIRNKTLLVNTLHSVWAQELTFMKPMLLQKLSHYLKPGDVVTDMVFRVGDIS
jgi:predicted nucleic acid-binding Zn ribbon protein